MEEWMTGGATSPDQAQRRQAVVGLLQHASTALQDARRQVDRLYRKVAIQASNARETLSQSEVDSAASTYLWDDLRALRREAEITWVRWRNSWKRRSPR